MIDTLVFVGFGFFMSVILIGVAHHFVKILAGIMFLVFGWLLPRRF